MSTYGLNLNMRTHHLQLESEKEMNTSHLMYIYGCTYTQKKLQDL